MENDPSQRTGRTMLIIAWACLFALLFAFFYYHENNRAGDYEITKGSVAIKPDSQGHYRIKGYINEKSVEFMVDTGASLVSIPKSIAESLQLQGQYPITLDTANGQVTGFLTRVDKLSFGDFDLKDVKAVIMPDNDDGMILLGMNVLSRFNLSQQNKKLIISY